MSTDTKTDVRTDTAQRRWIAGALAGVLGTAAFGLFQQAIGASAVIAVAIPAMYGVSGPALGVGWAIHLFHGAVLGLLFTAAVSWTPLARYGDRPTTSAALGLGYGALTWMLLAGLLMPVWLSTVGFPSPPPLPNLAVPGLVGHLVYGVVLGALYPLLARR